MHGLTWRRWRTDPNLALSLQPVQELFRIKKRGRPASTKDEQPAAVKEAGGKNAGSDAGSALAGTPSADAGAAPESPAGSAGVTTGK